MGITQHDVSENYPIHKAEPTEKERIAALEHEVRSLKEELKILMDVVRYLLDIAAEESGDLSDKHRRMAAGVRRLAGDKAGIADDI